MRFSALIGWLFRLRRAGMYVREQHDARYRRDGDQHKPENKATFHKKIVSLRKTKLTINLLRRRKKIPSP